MVPGYTRAELEYRVYSPLAEPVIQGAEDFAELPDWVDVGVYGPDSARFAPPELPADLPHRAELEGALTMYRVVASLPVRPFGDLHLEYALEAAVEIAEASRGVVLDVVTRRLWTAEELAAMAEEDERDGEVRVIVEPREDGTGRRARSVGMRKFGFVELVIPAVPRGCAAAARWVIEDACRSLIAGEARPGDTFEHEGAEIEIRPEEDGGLAMGLGPGGALVLTRVDEGSFEGFLADVAREAHEAGAFEDEDGEAAEALDHDHDHDDDHPHDHDHADGHAHDHDHADGHAHDHDHADGQPHDHDHADDHPHGHDHTHPHTPAHDPGVPETERTAVAQDIRGLLSPAELRVLVDPDAPVELVGTFEDDEVR